MNPTGDFTRSMHIEAVITSLRDIAEDPERYSPTIVGWIAADAAEMLREAHPVDYTAPPTEFENQVSMYDLLK